MAIPVIMPKQGQSVETCIITKWYIKKGDPVAKGDILLSYETDKAAFDLEAQADGILLDIFFPEGSEVPVLTNIAVIGSAGEETAEFSPGNAEKNIESPSRSFLQRIRNSLRLPLKPTFMRHSHNRG